MFRAQDKTSTDVQMLRHQFQLKQLEFKERYSSAVKQSRNPKHKSVGKLVSKKSSDYVKPKSTERSKSIDIF